MTLLLGALPVLAYQTGSVSRPNFSTAATRQGNQQDEEKEKSTVPGQKGVQTRSFSSYGARQNAWRQGVQTKSVQTQRAGAQKPQPKPQPGFEDPGEQTAQNARAALAGKINPAGKPQGNPQDPKAQQNAAQNPAQDMGAVMDQMKGVQDMMGGLGALMGGQGGAQGGKGGQAMPDMSALMGGGAGGQGMPDISALMGGAGAPGGKAKK